MGRNRHLDGVWGNVDGEGHHESQEDGGLWMEEVTEEAMNTPLPVRTEGAVLTGMASWR